MPTRNINLTEHDARFIETQVESGKYQDPSEVLRAGLRLLERQTRSEEEQFLLLKRLAREGFASLDQGEGLTFASVEDVEQGIAQIGLRAAKSTSKQQAEY